MSSPKKSGRGAGFVGALAGYGDRPAVIAADAEITYRQLAARLDERVAALGDGRRLVMISGANDLELLVTFLAALRGGHVAWLAPDAAGPGTPSLVSRFSPDLVVTAGPAGVDIEERNTGSGHDLHPDLALLLGTSGSTGAPRLVRISYDALQSNAASIAEYLEIAPSDRAVTALPVHYCYGLSVVNSHLLRGAGLILTDRSVTDPVFWDLMRDCGGTSFAGVPHTFDLLDRIGFDAFDLPTLRYITQAGGRMDPAVVRRYADLGARRGWQLVVMYGQTEATARMAYLPPHLAAAHPGAIGIPIPGGSIEIREDPDGDMPGVGEIVYRGPNVMLGYAESPADLALGRVVHELRTGDLGRRGPTGLYEVVGRQSRFLKLFGLRVDLQQVERLLAASGVQAACAGTDERLVVAVTGGACPAAAALLVAERVGLPPAAVAAHNWPEIPRLPSGKLDYLAITARATQPAPGPRARGVSGERCLLRRSRPLSIAAVFQEALGGRELGPHDSFAGLGGDSLTYVEMSVALEEVLGTLPASWPEMTVAELSRLERRRGRMTALETNIALRAAAIVLVVASHMTDTVPAGGAHLLLAIAGFNFARFQLAAIDAPRRLPRSLATVARIAVPTSVWIGLQMLLVGGFSLGAMLLVNNYTGDPVLTESWWYWFLEALVQILVVMAAVFSIPAVRRLERRRPFALALCLLAPALALRFEVVTFGGSENAIFRPHTVVWLFLLGWAAHRAAGPLQRALVSTLALASVPGFFGEPEREAIILAGLMLLLWLPAIRVPRPAARVAGRVAAGSMYIYLTHWQIWPQLTRVVPFEVALPLTVMLGILTWLAIERAPAAGRRAWGRLRSSPPDPPPLRQVPAQG